MRSTSAVFGAKKADRVTMALGDQVSGTFAIHRLHRRFWSERNLNVKLEGKS